MFANMNATKAFKEKKHAKTVVDNDSNEFFIFR